jgi:signal transduction histidine kinase
MLLAENGPIEPDAKESLELIEEATRRCRTIVQKLMTYAKKPIDSAEIFEVNLFFVAKNVISFLEYQLGQDNIRVVVDAPDEEYCVAGNQNEFEQVLTNMILNARDAIRQERNKGEILILFAKTDKKIKVTIQDDGCGMAEDVIPKIFDPFFTTKEVGKGLGLGLSICHSIIEKYNGTITVSSQPAKGSKFTIELPEVKERSGLKSKVRF